MKGIVIVQTEQIKSGDSETDGTRRMPGREGGGEGRAGMVEGGEGPTLSPTLWWKHAHVNARHASLATSGDL